MKKRPVIGLLALLTAVTAAGTYIRAEEPETTETPETEEEIEETVESIEETTSEEGDVELPWIDDDEYVSGYYTYTLGSRGAVIEKYSGKENTVTIPTKLRGKPVAVIGTRSFRNNTSISEVKVPSGVTRIGANAFEGCTSLNTLTIPLSLTEISDSAFKDCGSMTVYYYGSESQWNQIKIGNNNDPLENADIIFCSISFTEDTIVLPTEETHEVTAVSQPEDVKDHLVWSSSNEKVAVIDENGTITAKTYGTSVITAAYADNAEITADITVKTLFYDVKDSTQSYYKPVYWGADNGVVAGYDKGVYFGPDNDCTRAQFVTFLWRLAGRQTGDQDVSFPDVDPNESYYRAVKWAVSEGIIVGYKHEDGPATFEPNGTVTRGQVATMLWRFAGRKTPELPSTSPFSDIDASNSSYRAVVWGQKAGVIKGYKDGTFQPDASCLRQHIVTFLYRYARDVMKKKV